MNTHTIEQILEEVNKSPEEKISTDAIKKLLSLDHCTFDREAVLQLICECDENGQDELSVKELVDALSR
ncbi:unnamed protein product [Calicophoron daubneyi]|uniref:EF-hand domain-containing protein n=1 Tax=Calicophoron daubneyi TaxID=300641 RepID=A0AAV2T663_CALDB